MTNVIKDNPNREIDPTVTELQEQCRTTVVDASDILPQWQATEGGFRKEPKTMVHG